MRQWPSEQFTTIKRSFFTRGDTFYPIDTSIVALKGVYSSIRLCHVGTFCIYIQSLPLIFEQPRSTPGGKGTGVAINVDVANGTFWASQDLHQAARNFLKDNNRNASWDTFRLNLMPVKDKLGHFTWSEDFKTLRKMAKLKFTVKHRGKSDGMSAIPNRENLTDIDLDQKQYSIKRFTFAAKAGGAHAKNTMFKFKNRDTNTEEEISVYDYFRRTYNLTISMWDIPLVETDRYGMFPMELCILVPNQRYSYKLNPEQTAAMIKFAVTRPKERLKSIQHGIGMLKWHEDRYLRHFGFTVDPNMTSVNLAHLQFLITSNIM